MNKKKKAILVLVVVLAISFLLPMFVYNHITMTNRTPEDDGMGPDASPELSAVSDTALYNVSYANITYGSNTTVIWETGAMDASDATNASFLETVSTTSPDTLLGDTATDSADNWEGYYRFDNLETVADGAVGSTSVRAQFTAQAGEPILRFDNNTAYIANIDTVDMDHFNFSIKASAAGSTLHTITFHNTDVKFYRVTADISVTTSWTLYDYTRAQAVSVGGMTAADVINWIDFTYTSPVVNRWMYIDAPMFYNTLSQVRFGASFNFTSIADYQHYSLNVSAAANCTSPETMRISDAFDYAATYDIDGTEDWNNYTIDLNATYIQSANYLVVFINSTLLSDTDNSTLDIDLFQVYAWNETNTYPVITVDPTVTNPDDTDTLYAYYRVYTATVNVSDADGVNELDWIQFGMEDEDSVYAWKAGYHYQTGVWEVIHGVGNVSLVSASCTNLTGTVMTTSSLVTIGFYVTTSQPSLAKLLLCMLLNDTSDAEVEVEVGSYKLERDTDISELNAYPTSGSIGHLIDITGYIIYFNSSDLVPPDAYYDIWLTSDWGSPPPPVEVDVWETDGYFGGIRIAGGDVGVETISVDVQAEGSDAGDGTSLSHDTDTVSFTVTGGHGGDDGGDDDEWWELDWEEDWWIIIILIIIMIMIITGCCGMEGFGCEGEDGFGCRPRRRRPKVKLSRRRKATTTRKYNRGRIILGGFRLRKPFTLMRKGMGSSTGFARAIKALLKGLRFKR